MKKGYAVINIVLVCIIISCLCLVYNYFFLTSKGVIGLIQTKDLNASIPADIHSNLFVNTESSSTIKVLIGGDIMLDRKERLQGEKNGYNSLFAGISKLFHSMDIVVANLEGPITTNESKTLLKNGQFTQSFSFTFATSTAVSLAQAGIDLVSLANNHSQNFGNNGIDETHYWLTNSGIDWFGDPNNISGTEKILCKNEICLAFVGYHEFAPGLDTILTDVKRLAGEGYPVIVMPHWGDEYALLAPERIRVEAEKFVQAGAIAIIGSHPHVRENREWIGNVPVIYSLGNLVFDQFFSKEVMTGNIAELTISKNGLFTHIDKVRLYTISNASRTGPVIVGEPIDF